ncbi:MAG: hypothetical protein NT020_04620 [Chloroflexales bacterium]|nr:hypothetical protein [Chloroflexales bacterium]
MNHLINLHQRLLITSVTVLFLAMASVAFDWWRHRDVSQVSYAVMVIMWLLLFSNAVVGGMVARQSANVSGLHILYGVLIFWPPAVMWYLRRWIDVRLRARYCFLGLLITAVLIHRVVATG